MEYPHIIVLGGQARSGKDSVASILVEDHGYTQLSFAGAVKDYAVEYFGLSRLDVDVIKDPNTRRILQGIGQMFRQVIDLNYWVGIVNSQTGRDARIVVSDGRYINEYEWAKRNSGQVWRINRLGLNGGGNQGIVNHPSEVEQLLYNDWDYVIDNVEGEGWQENLRAKVKDALCNVA